MNRPTIAASRTAAAEHNVALPALLRRFCIASICLTVVAIVVRFVCAHLPHFGIYPYGFYVTRADGLDLMSFYVRFQHIHSPAFFSPAWGPGYAYPAAVAPLYWLLFRVRHAQIPFVILGAAITLGFGWLWIQALERHGLSRNAARWFVAVALVCSYPLYFEFARGNVEIFMWAFTSAAIYFILKDRIWLGAALLGIAIAMKIYPFIFLGLLISRRKYAPILLAAAIAVGYSVFSLWFICPDLAVAQQGVNQGLQGIQNLFVIPYRPILSGVDHSLYGLMKRLLPVMTWPQYAHLLKAYTIVAAVAGVVLYFARIRKLPAINEVLCLTIAMTLLPPMSFDYTLIHLYTPFALLAVYWVDAAREGREAHRGSTGMMICFVILLAQIGEAIFHGDRLGGQIKAVALLPLFALSLYFEFPGWLDREPATR